MTKILISLTTLNNPDWRKNIADLKKFDIREFAFFPTVIPTEEERLAIMRAIKKELGSVSVPFCHIRVDVTQKELDFLIDNFDTKKFNVHADKEFRTSDLFQQYKSMIYVENAGPCFRHGFEEADIEGFAGLCLDLSHLENSRLLQKPNYENDLVSARKYPIGMNHISAITKTMEYIEKIDLQTFDRHVLSSLNEVDYTQKYYPDYFGEFAALEVWNSIESQIEIKKYLEKLLGL